MGKDGNGRRSRLPIVFLGPSLPRDQASQALKADYRPPIRRGDLDSIPSGSIVAIIDGVFDQDLSVSPSEIRAALGRGIQLFGASSMGALRAVEVPGVRGVGRIYEMYRSGAIDGDDEVAVVFDPVTLQPLSEPLVNVRHAVQQLTGTISRGMAAALVAAARRLPYAERSYPRMLKAAGLDDRRETSQLIRMLGSYDLKREDALTLLEQLRQARTGATSVNHPPGPTLSHIAGPVAQPLETDAIHCWEFGPPLPLHHLVDFLAMTGSLSSYAVKALARMGKEDVDWKDVKGPSPNLLLDRLLAQTARAWGWATEEEVERSLADLGLCNDEVEAGLAARVEAELKAMALTRGRSDRFFRALAVELFLDDLALKREAARAVCLDWLADRGRRLGTEALETNEEQAAADKLCQLLDVRDLDVALDQLSWWGIAPENVRLFLSQLAFARRAAGSPRLASWGVRAHSWLRSSPKAAGSRRFCAKLSHTYSVVKQLQPVVGITRVAVITGLGTIGIPNAQAFRPDGEWSSTVGSGKSESTVGARVGAVMEEIEKWAQEEFAHTQQDNPAAVSSYEKLRRSGRRVLDPSTLDLPYDTCYNPDLEIGWHSCVNLAGGGSLLVPTAAITHRRTPNDIYYSPRGGRKTVSTNGLAAGLTVAEALTHALCEYIERHARAVDCIATANPGGRNAVQKPFLDLDTVPRSTRRLIGKIARAGHRIVVQDITSEIAVPTFNATILLSEGSLEGQLFSDGWRRASGWAAHPDPETALNMAILEASQTIMTHVAGAREDLVLHARSLGRHDRTDSRRRAPLAAELDADVPRLCFAAVRGMTSRDAAEDVLWILKQLRKAGWQDALIADYSSQKIKPVRVVRAIIPGLETINPFYTGLKGRAALLSDLLPPAR